MYLFCFLNVVCLFFLIKLVIMTRSLLSHSHIFLKLSCKLFLPLHNFTYHSASSNAPSKSFLVLIQICLLKFAFFRNAFVICKCVIFHFRMEFSKYFLTRRCKLPLIILNSKSRFKMVYIYLHVFISNLSFLFD